MKYLEFLRLDLIHPYYADQRCPDLEIQPTSQTEKLLRGCRGILRQTPGGILIVLPVTEQNNPFIALPKNPVFAFHLQLRNPNFALFTDLTEISATAAPLYTNSAPAKSGNLKLVSRKASATEQFVVNKPAQKETFSLAGHPLESIKTAGAFTVDGLSTKSGRKTYDENARTIAINTVSVKAGTPFKVSYPITPQPETGVFADVEINYDNSQASLTQPAGVFQIAFKAKQARWKYYLVTDPKMTSATLVDQDQVVIFDAKGQTDLTKSPDPADEIAGVLAERYPNMQYFRFLSNALIPCQQTARKGLQLQLNGTKAMDSLSNPALQNYSIDTRSSQQEYTLHQVVKYFTQ